MVDDGGWQQGQIDGGIMKNVATTSGRMHASGFNPVAAGLYDDSVCCRAGWNNSYHFITAVVYRAPGYNPTANHELELNVAIQMGTNSVKLYSWIWNTQGAASFTRWNGPMADFNILTPTGPGIPGGRQPVDGDIMGFEYDATNPAQVVLNGYLWNHTTGDWELILTFTDTSAQRIQFGNPGAAFFVRDGDTVLASFGFKYWIANSGRPTWLNGVAIGAWKEIPNSSMGLVAGLSGTTPTSLVSSRMDAYNGLAYKGTEVYSVRCGGHTDYFGNEVLRFDAHSNTPGWTLIKPWSTVAQSGLNQLTNYWRYPDGEVSSSHTYAHQRYIKARNWIMQVANTAVAVNGGTSAECMVYNIATNAYGADGTIPNGPSPAIADNGIWDDPDKGDVYHVLAYTINRWNQASNTWSLGLKSVPNIYGTKTVAATDTLRRRAVILGGDEPTKREPTVYGLDDNSTAPITVTGDTALTTQGQFGLDFCPTLDRFYAMTGGANGAGLYEMNPTTWAVSAKSTTGATGMPAQWGNGVYTRFKYLPTLGGLIYFPRHSANAWFLRLH